MSNGKGSISPDQVAQTLHEVEQSLAQHEADARESGDSSDANLINEARSEIERAVEKLPESH